MYLMSLSTFIELLIVTVYAIVIYYQIEACLDDCNLVHVEEDPRRVAHQEGGHDCHQNEGEIVLLLPPPTPPPLTKGRIFISPQMDQCEIFLILFQNIFFEIYFLVYNSNPSGKLWG